ncbi:hypothetical protein OsJ_12853 [Oryza sativa Japonica Group]|uniref:Uncharacterized protein n=1 Tax=Oryza sativa subsp. japonica TaxID=39947 RepID=B9F6C3_ORYSJ|nr:hypothetical protein OsJ_12853 [Oryza sativa Japonica Group]
MPLCSFYASTSLPVAKPHSLPSSSSSKPYTATPAPAPTAASASASAAALSLHLPELPSRVKDKILSLELMGVDYGRALALNPALRDAAPESIHAVVTFLQSRGLHFKDLGRVFGMCPSLLTASLDFLAGLGMHRDDAVAMVLRCPALFTFSIERNYKPKFEYLVAEMGGGVHDIKAFPQYFTFSLDKRIAPRHRAAADAGVSLPLPDMLKATDEEFMEMLDKEIELQKQAA